MKLDRVGYDYVIMSAKSWYGNSRVTLIDLLKFLLSNERGDMVVLKVLPVGKSVPYYIVSAGIPTFRGSSPIGAIKSYIVDTGNGYSGNKRSAKVLGMGVMLTQHSMSGTSALSVLNNVVLNYFGDMSLSEVGMFYVMK